VLFPFGQTLPALSLSDAACSLGIERMEGLQSCVLLEKMWLIGGTIKRIEGLEKNVKLK
jgi:hypothetical protein